MFHFFKDTNKISRYFISPGVCEQPDGKFQSAVSLKSGQGSVAQDTVYTFSKLFETAQEAVDHAKQEGMQLALMK
ncbi:MULTISPECIES: hypothetical protein [Comamonas]|jgi:hypothetical protein|uniref:Uncharacterized protein n=1 Tax=Comamonas squillarum TaxID=2977320 RepID=A0ABY5ZY77_9BURK|nr:MULTISPECIES: hypothetical protein [Comamonas]PWB19718.1 hypothetical protein DCO45_07260 [Comamonas sp. JNW]UXC18881.1 hypothetical protein N4T19_01730 [Comamonas sp. PR12]